MLKTIENIKKNTDLGSFGSIIVEGEGENPTQLFDISMRYNNPRRNFLFVSKVLAKHAPAKFSMLEEACQKLTQKWLQAHNLKNATLTQKTLVIGFAETATAMGHCFFSQLDGPINFAHSTRESIDFKPEIFTFEEEHSHATSHRFYIPKDIVEQSEHIVLVDDELTTGKTCLNLIESIKAHYPHKEFSVATFLDWRNEQEIQVFEKNQIKVSTLFQGQFELVNWTERSTEATYLKTVPQICDWNIQHIELPKSNNYLHNTGRFSLGLKEHSQTQALLEAQIQNLKLSGTTLVIGTGEFMYWPLQIASILGDLPFHATTRSPMFPCDQINYGSKNAIKFQSLYGEYTEYLYNIFEADNLIVCVEPHAKNVNTLLNEIEVFPWKQKILLQF